jgi:4-hydroxybenzoyl-CoA thioesterase
MGRKFIKEEKVRFQHCDHAGIVFYPRYFVMLNDLVEDWFEEILDYSFLAMHPNNGIPTVELNTRFKSPARLGDLIQKELWVIRLTDRSLTYGFCFSHHQKTVIEGTGVVVHVAVNDLQKKLAPQAWGGNP